MTDYTKQNLLFFTKLNEMFNVIPMPAGIKRRESIITDKSHVAQVVLFTGKAKADDDD